MNTTRRHLARLAAASTALLLVVGYTAITGTESAQADSRFTVQWTHIGIYPRSAPSMTAEKVGNALSDGAPITIVCETSGEAVTSDAGTSTIWERLSSGTYLPNVFVDTGASGWTPGVPRCDAAPSAPVGQTYDRQAAAAYALSTYTEHNVGFIPKCTYFASAVLHAGGIPTTDQWRPDSNDVNAQASKPLYFGSFFSGPTKEWASADHLKNYLVNNGLGTLHEVSLAAANPGVQLGDIVLYDWGSEGSPGIIDHIAVVTGFDAAGVATVTQKEPDQQTRQWNWSNSGNGNIGSSNPGTRAYVITITY